MKEPTLKEIYQALDKMNVPYNEWGKSLGAKDKRKFEEYVKNGEYQITILPDGTCKNTVDFLDILVTYKNKTLSEDRQVYKNGKVVISKISRPDIRSVGEKLLPGEKTLNGVFRAMEEELGISEKQIKDYKHTGTIYVNKDSSAFPGLPTTYNQYQYTVELMDTGYNPDGYKEVQEDKTTYFVWN